MGVSTRSSILSIMPMSDPDSVCVVDFCAASADARDEAGTAFVNGNVPVGGPTAIVRTAQNLHPNIHISVWSTARPRLSRSLCLVDTSAPRKSNADGVLRGRAATIVTSIYAVFETPRKNPSLAPTPVETYLDKVFDFARKWALCPMAAAPRHHGKKIFVDAVFLGCRLSVSCLHRMKTECREAPSLETHWARSSKDAIGYALETAGSQCCFRLGCEIARPLKAMEYSVRIGPEVLVVPP